MTEYNVVNRTQAELNKIILADTQCNQFSASLDNRAFLLSLSLAEENVLKLWIQDRKAIRVDDSGPIEDYNQLIYQIERETGLVKAKLVGRHGYQDIERGKEIEFLARMLSQGTLSKIEK